MSRSLWPRSPCSANPDSTHAPRRLHSHHAGHPAPTIMWESNPNSGSLPTESGFGETALKERRMGSHYDMIIIGSGAGGGTMALALAPTGKRILLLERGHYLRREQDNWHPDAVFVRGKYQAKETWYDRDGRPFHPGLHYFAGVNTKVYGGALFRLRPQDFEEIVHADGLSPAWPVGYAEFEPHYTAAERLFHVHGLRGVDPTEGWASAPSAHPPVRHEPRIQALCDALEREGHHPFPQPLAILLEEDADGRVAQYSSCIRCSA